MSAINPAIFDSTYSIFNSFNTYQFSWSYVDDSKIKLSFANSGDTSYFREYTYVYLNNDSSKKVMIWKIDGGDIYLDKPPSFLGPNLGAGFFGTNISRITNIDGLLNISDILYEVYKNVEYDWYITKKDNIRRRICSQYAILLSKNDLFQRNVTGLLYENEFNEFVLKLYDLENDSQLSFTTVELMSLGADRRTRIPVPLDLLNSDINITNSNRTTTNSSSALKTPTSTITPIEINVVESYTKDWNILDDGLTYTGVTALDYISTNTTDELFDFGLDVVLGGPNEPPLMFTIIDGNGYPINPLN
jgi:hypothetical protein